MPAFRRSFLLSVAAFALIHAAWAQDTWMLWSREGACSGLDLLARREELPRVPVSPDDFAAMIRPLHPTVTVGLPDGFPQDMAGKVVMVRWAENRAPIFVRAEMCR